MTTENLKAGQALLNAFLSYEAQYQQLLHKPSQKALEIAVAYVDEQDPEHQDLINLLRGYMLEKKEDLKSKFEAL